MYKLFSILSVFTFLVSCNKTFNNKEEYLSFIQETENGFHKTKSVNGIEFNLTYRPTDLMVLQERVNSKKAVDSLRNKYKNYLYFILSISKSNRELLTATSNTREDFNILLNQLTFRMKDKAFIYTSKKDTLNPTDYIYPRTYLSNSTTSLMFVFRNDSIIEKAKSFTFHLKDIGLQTGEISFKFFYDKILNQPKLNYEAFAK